MDFPDLHYDQHAILAAEVQTGIILDLEGKRWRKDEPKNHWRVFDSFAEAREFAVAKIAQNPTIELWIYDKKDHPVERISVR